MADSPAFAGLDAHGENDAGELDPGDWLGASPAPSLTPSGRGRLPARGRRIGATARSADRPRSVRRRLGERSGSAWRCVDATRTGRPGHGR